MLSVGAPFPDEYQLDYSIAVQYEGCSTASIHTINQIIVFSGENFTNLVNSESPAIVVPVTKSLSKRKIDVIDARKGKCVSCIGMPIDELKWLSLEKYLKILLRFCSSLEVAQIMKAEKECKENHLRPEQLIMNRKQLHDDELAEIFGIILVLEFAGNAARDNKKSMIIPRRVLFDVKNDDEL
ncbi:hypothetical protein AgCh_030910 [Apium graveolens]